MLVRYKTLFPILLLGIFLSFQNCGDPFESQDEESFSVTRPPSKKDNEDILYQSYLYVDLAQLRYQVSLVEIAGSPSEFELRFKTSIRGDAHINYKDDIFADYQDYPPRAIYLAMPQQYAPKSFLFVSDNLAKMMLLRINPNDTVEILWETNQVNLSSYQDFLANVSPEIHQGVYYLIIRNQIVANANTDSLNISSCELEFNQISNGQCVGGVRSCLINNGTGSQQWNGEEWGPCTLTSCNTGYHATNSSTCEPNVIVCSDPSPGSAGTRTWNPVDEVYDDCIINQCNQGGYHLEDNSCLSDTKACEIDNGLAQETWNPEIQDYGACTLTSCNQSFLAFENTCRAERRSCTIANGTGEEVFDTETGDYGVCTVTDCDNDYELIGNFCQYRIDGSKIYYAQASGMTATEVRNACNSFPFSKPVGCLSGRLREADAQGKIAYGYGTEGELSAAGTHAFIGESVTHYCYQEGQEQTGQALDILVGIKCSNVETDGLFYFGLPAPTASAPPEDSSGNGTSDEFSCDPGTFNECRECSIANGVGVQFLISTDTWSDCNAQSCDAGFTPVTDGTSITCQ